MKPISLLKCFFWVLSLFASVFLNVHAGNQIHYVINDHLGTPQMLVDQNQNVVWKANYDAFGMADIVVEQVEFNIRFPGQYYDKETGLHYNYYRDYDPTTGRYVQSDPIGLRGGINTYAYVGGNPVDNIDFYGLSSADVEKIKNGFNDKVKNMTENGMRMDPYFLNNIPQNFRCLVFNDCAPKDNDYLQCWAQTNEMSNYFNDNYDSFNFDDKWSFQHIWEKNTSNAHHWLEATSNNQSDPKVILDTWRGDSSVIPR